MGWAKRQYEQMLEERQRKQEELLEVPAALFSVVEKLDEISASLDHTLQRFQPAETDRVFLSHKTIDKPRVLRFKNALHICGFQPWIDEDEMPAGTHLDAAILNGMKRSCAVVFFITPHFKDDRFLKREIEYAIIEERERPGEFMVIPLLLDGADDAYLPPLLSPFVRIAAQDDFEALLEIVKALPIRPGPPVPRNITKERRT